MRLIKIVLSSVLGYALTAIAFYLGGLEFVRGFDLAYAYVVCLFASALLGMIVHQNTKGKK